MRKSLLGSIIALAGITASPASALGQAVPGRDLLAYPIGLVAEPAGLPSVIGLGTYNPADARLTGGVRGRLAAASMTTPADVGASAQVAGASATWNGTTITASVLRAAVGGLVRTDSDPLTVGNDVTYSTVVASLGIAVAVSEHLTWGVALRGRTGQLDLERRGAAALDLGVLAERLTRFDARIGAATFLASPGRAASDPPTWIAAADVRAAGRDSLREARVGFSAVHTAGRPSEQFAFTSLRLGAWEVRGGPVRTAAYGATNVRTRLAVAVRHRGYAVGLSREEMLAGFTPTYQFVLSSTVR